MLCRSFTSVALLLCIFFAATSLTTASDSCGADSAPADGTYGGDLCTAPPAVREYVAHVVEDEWTLRSPTLRRIRERGHLVCAHIDFTLGHSRISSPTDASGMEPDLCRGLSAALGLEQPPRFHVMLQPSERFPLLHSGSVDVVFALTSKTIGRDIQERGHFSVPYFQDEHNMMFRADRGIDSAASLEGKRICVTRGTTNPNVLGDYLASLYAAGVLPQDSVHMDIVDEDADALRSMVRMNGCDAFVNDHSVVAGYVHTESPPAGTTYQLASWAGTPFARAPFSAVTCDGDDTWGSIVDWFVQGLYLAEMYDINAHNVASKSTDLSIPGEAQRLLGSQLVNGHALPLRMAPAIALIGNYAELYDRNFGHFLPRSRANMLYKDGGSVFPGGWR